MNGFNKLSFKCSECNSSIVANLAFNPPMSPTLVFSPCLKCLEAQGYRVHELNELMKKLKKENATLKEIASFDRKALQDHIDERGE